MCGIKSKGTCLLFSVALLLSPLSSWGEEVFEITETELSRLETTLQEQSDTLSEQRTTLEAQATTIERLESTIEMQQETTQTLRTSFDEYESEVQRRTVSNYAIGGAVGVAVGAITTLILTR